MALIPALWTATLPSGRNGQKLALCSAPRSGVQVARMETEFRPVPVRPALERCMRHVARHHREGPGALGCRGLARASSDPEGWLELRARREADDRRFPLSTTAYRMREETR
jgi:hypothetical protein